MKIIYPPLVEQSFQFYQANDEQEYSKSELYRSMVENHIIYENGAPTPEAIEQGLVRDFYEEPNLSFQDFLTIYPIFQSYDSTLFQRIDGFWEIPLDIKNELLGKLVLDEISYDEKIQIEEFLENR
ncbi:hypothetical protein [Enterococcus malodoratus]|uniref:hypothetical protein n=1 Tax=Enterococcus malodoratus TaxID=71451 RepID=UPI00207436C7|nr:hypothetical protein [Enterococcus malodoratus]